MDSLPAVASLTIGNPAPNQDSDADGISDLLEYALGLDASMPSPPVWPKLTFDVVSGLHYQTLSYPLGPIRPPDVTTAFEVTGDLRAWTAATLLPTVNELKARDTVSSDAAAHRFIRLKVTRPTP